MDPGVDANAACTGGDGGKRKPAPTSAVRGGDAAQRRAASRPDQTAWYAATTTAGP